MKSIFLYTPVSNFSSNQCGWRKGVYVWVEIKFLPTSVDGKVMFGDKFTFIRDITLITAVGVLKNWASFNRNILFPCLI